MAIFPEAYVINLNRRPDRWVEVERQLKKYLPESIAPVRVEAVDSKDRRGMTGVQALCHSVLNVIDIIKRRKTEGLEGEWVIVVEDDVKLHRQFRFWFAQLEERLKTMWQDTKKPAMIYLGANQYDLKNHDASLKKMKEATQLEFTAQNTNTFGSYAMLYNTEALLTMLAPIIHQFKGNSPYDHILNRRCRVGASSQWSAPIICKPNLMLPDVRDSDLRQKRDMKDFARTRHLVLEDYDIDCTM